MSIALQEEEFFMNWFSALASPRKFVGEWIVKFDPN